MVSEAEANKDVDQKRRGAIEARNQAESMIHTVEKSLVEHGDEVPKEDKERVEKAIVDLKGVLDSDDKQLIEEKLQVLSDASMKLGEIVYRKAQEKAANEQAAAGGGTESPADEASAQGPQPTHSTNADDIVDADFMELDEDDNAKH